MAQAGGELPALAVLSDDVLPIWSAMTTAQDLMKEINKVMGDGTVRLGSDPELEVTYLPTGILPMDALLEGGLPRGRFTEVFGDYCVAPETPILTDALTWVPAGELLPDYGLIGFDEVVNQGRGSTSKMWPSQVEHIGNKRLESVRVVTNRGELTVSVDHEFVARHRTQRHREWRKAHDIDVGDSLVWFTEPWATDNSREAGYAAGIFDGEGWLDGRRISFGQVPGVVLDEAILVLKRLGFEVSVGNQGNGVCRVTILGGRMESMRAIGQLRPHRMLAQSEQLWVGRDLSKKGPMAIHGSSEAIVEAVERVGMRDVVTMQTSTRTFIANGFLSHNSTLKSYVGLRTIAETQAAGGVCALIDTEHAFDPEWAKNLGVDLDDLILEHPITGELAVDVTEALIRAKVDLIVWDSVAATLPQAEREKRAHGENVQPARLAALMSQAMRKLTAANAKTAILMINQTRINVGQMFGSNEAVPGGKALPFYASYRVALRKSSKLTRDVKVWNGQKNVTVKETYAQMIRATVEKSKLNRPHRDTYFTFDLDRAEIDEVGFMITYGLEHGLVSREGKTWKVKGSKKGVVGTEAFREMIKQTPRARMRLRKMVLDSLGLSNPLSNEGETEKAKSSRS